MNDFFLGILALVGKEGDLLLLLFDLSLSPLLFTLPPDLVLFGLFDFLGLVVK